MKDGSQFERFLPGHNARPELRDSYRGHDIFVADSGPHFDPENDKNLAGDWREYKDGYYASVALVPGKIATAVCVCHFKYDHDRELTEAGRKQARLNAVLGKAREHIDLGVEGGMYHG